MAETLVVGRHRSSRGPVRESRRRTIVGLVAAGVVCLGVLGGSVRLPSCADPDEPTPRSFAGLGDADIRDLHLTALDRPYRTGDRPPAGLMPADVTSSARRVLTSEAMDVYLAGGRDFACLAVDAHGQAYPAPAVCLLDQSIANSGLVVPLQADAAGDSVAVVAMPDGWTDVSGGTRVTTDFPNGMLVHASSRTSLALASPSHRVVRVIEADVRVCS